MWLSAIAKQDTQVIQTRKPKIFGKRSRLLLSMCPKVMSSYFTSKTVTLVLTPRGHPRSNQTVPIVAAFKEVIPGVQPRICHRFQNILNQMIVTLTFNLSRSSKVKPVGTLYNLHWVQHRNSCRS